MGALCPVCSSADVEEVLRTDRVPVLVGTVWRTREEAFSAPVGSVALTFCRSCGFLFNPEFVPGSLDYSPDFDIELHHSPTYQSYLEDEANLLIRRYGLRHGTIVEVGCGHGHVLRLFCRLAESDGFGFDPSFGRSTVEQLGENSITFVNDFFDERSNIPGADLILSRSVLESIPDPFALLRTLRRAIGHESRTVLYLEVPNASWVFERQKTWNFYYEHCSYFTADLLPRLLAASGFETIVCEPCYDDGQHLRVEAVPSQVAGATISPGGENLADVMREYRRAYERDVALWRSRLNELRAAGKRVAIWGAGGRGITFLNTAGGGIDTVALAVDINPARQGKYLPLTGQRIVAAEGLLADPVDVAIITNATYEPEIRKQAGELGIGCSFVVL